MSRHPRILVADRRTGKSIPYTKEAAPMTLLRSQTPVGSAVRAFLTTFVAVFLTAVLPLLDRAVADITDKGRVSIDFGYVVALLLAAAIAALAAAIRFVLAKLVA